MVDCAICGGPCGGSAGWNDLYNGWTVCNACLAPVAEAMRAQGCEAVEEGSPELVTITEGALRSLGHI